jgi:CubicO group peptidase (beta-lactamase class C family)
MGKSGYTMKQVKRIHMKGWNLYLSIPLNYSTKSNTMRKLIYFISMLLLANLQAACQNNESKALDELMNSLFPDDGPGGVALVVRDGEVLYRKAFGMADLELEVKMTPDNVFRIGSITKQFTACAILKLAEEGKLDLQDDITRFIADYPTHGYHISIEHLLTHTSGIKSYTGMEEWTAELRRKDFTTAELVDLFKNQPMDFAPGEEYRYNNSAYFLLGYVVELISGMSYGDYIDSTFFKPLGMKNSYYGSTSRIIPHRASGYSMDRGIYKNAEFLSMTQPHGAGALISTVDDLYTWYRAVMDGEVISDKSLKKATTSYVLNNGRKTGYGYGWSLGNIQRSPRISHGGGINGYLTASIYLPEEELFVAVFSNCTCRDPDTDAVKMAAISLGKPYEWDSISMDDELLKSYEAVYTSEFDGDLFIRYHDGRIYAMRSGGSETALTPFERDKFFVKDGTSTFHFISEEDKKISAVVSKSTGYDIRWERSGKALPSFEAINLDASVLEDYPGTYEFGPDFKLEVFQEGILMYARATGQEKFEIYPIDMDVFLIRGADVKLVFNRGTDGSIESLILHQNGEYRAKKTD